MKTVFNLACVTAGVIVGLAVINPDGVTIANRKLNIKLEYKS